jgi:hypothetical protein
MTIIRPTRYVVEPSNAEALLERRAVLLDAIRSRCGGPDEARLLRVDARTWMDMWRWDSDDALRAALEAAPGMPEAAAAFALTKDVDVEEGALVTEDAWSR